MTARSAIGKVFVCFVLLVLCASCLAFYQRPSKDTQEISNPASPLLKLVLTKADFSGNWQWAMSNIFQQVITPTIENDELVEKASYGLWGSFRDDSNYIVIGHILEKHSTSSLAIEQIDIKTDMGMPRGQVFTPTLAITRTDQVAQCALDPGISKQDHRAACRVIVRYGSLVSTVAFSAIGKMDRDTIELILNEILTKIDHRIQNGQ